MSSKPIIQAIEAGNDMVAEAKCGISIEAENPKALADAIESLLQKPDDELLEMGEKGRAFAMENHTYKKLAYRFIEIMEED
jgi:glycosyltransferase involved in cell wall biosynthesis